MNVKNSSQNTVKKYEELTFTDDFMFCKVMQNNPDLCKHLIELIIGKKITMITYPDTQKAIEITADGKGIRMDVYVEGDGTRVIELCGLDTDICVITNALIIKTLYPYPDVEVTVDASCCAGSTPEKHTAALEVMKSCQINVIGE